MPCFGLPWSCLPGFALAGFSCWAGACFVGLAGPQVLAFCLALSCPVLPGAFLVCLALVVLVVPPRPARLVFLSPLGLVLVCLVLALSLVAVAVCLQSSWWGVRVPWVLVWRLVGLGPLRLLLALLWGGVVASGSARCRCMQGPVAISAVPACTVEPPGAGLRPSSAPGFSWPRSTRSGAEV